MATKETENPAVAKVANAIVKLEHLSATRVTVKIEDALTFLKDIDNDLNQPVEPET